MMLPPLILTWIPNLVTSMTAAGPQQQEHLIDTGVCVHQAPIVIMTTWCTGVYDTRERPMWGMAISPCDMMVLLYPMNDTALHLQMSADSGVEHMQ